MSKFDSTILEHIDAQIAARSMLKHEFYLAWTRGELSVECLQEYAKDYYQHVKAFPQYLSALHSHTACQQTRRTLLQNLIEEEAGSPNHPELWRNFALALGVTSEELDAHQPSTEMQALIHTYRNICREQSTAEGIAALYAYESQIPAVCVSKIDGLKTHYEMHNPKDWEYFSIHIDADKEHAAQERELLSNYVDEENSNAVITAVDRALDSLWNFLSGIAKRHNICQACHHA